MAEKKHQKHTKLSKPNYGFFGRNEWGDYRHALWQYPAISL